MTKRRLFSFFMALAMLVSMFPMSMSASEAPADGPIDLKVVVTDEDGNVNVGDTVTAEIYATSTEAANMASFNLTLVVPEGLEIATEDVFTVSEAIERVVEDGALDPVQNDTQLGWYYGNDDVPKYIEVTAEKDVLLATVKFVAMEKGTATIDLSNVNVSLDSDALHYGYTPDVTAAEVTVHDITVTVAANENAGIEAATLKARFEEPGLYDADGNAWTLPEVVFAENYREGEGWLLNGEAFDLESDTYNDGDVISYDAELYYVVTAIAGEGGEVNYAEGALDVAAGTNLLEALEVVEITEDDFYAFDDWYYVDDDEVDKKVSVNDTVEAAVTVKAKFTAQPVDVTFDIGYVGGDGDAADPKVVEATYGEYLVIEPAELAGYVLTAVEGMAKQADGTWKSDAVINGDMSVQLTYNKILEHTFASNISGVTYASIYSVAGVEGVYTNAALTEEATALPVVEDVTVETDKERYTFDGATWAVELNELSGTGVTTAVVSKLNAVHQYYVTFAVAEDAELTNAKAVEAATGWYEAGNAVTYPDATTADESISAKFDPAQITALNAATTVTVTTEATPLVTINTTYVGTTQSAVAELTGKYYGDAFGYNLNTPADYVAEVVVKNAEGVEVDAPETITEALTVEVTFREVYTVTFKAAGYNDIVRYAKAGVAALYEDAACTKEVPQSYIDGTYVVKENDTRYNYGEQNDYGYTGQEITENTVFDAEYTTEYYITFVGNADVVNVPTSDWYEEGAEITLSTESKNEFYTVSWDKEAAPVSEATAYTASITPIEVVTLDVEVVGGGDAADFKQYVEITEATFGEKLAYTVNCPEGYIYEASPEAGIGLSGYVTLTVTFRKVLTVTFVKTGVETYTFDAVAGIAGLTKDGATAEAPALTQYETIVENESRYNYGENPAWGYTGEALTEDATYTVTPTKDYYITATAGDGVESVSGTDWYAEGAAFPALTATVKTGYNADAITWTPERPETVTAAGDYTASAEVIKYNVTFAGDDIVTDINGVTAGKVNYGGTVTFKVNAAKSDITVVGAEYTVSEGVYTIANITADVTVTVKEYYDITFKAEGEGFTALPESFKLYPTDGKYLTAVPAYSTAFGYKFVGYKIGETTYTAETILTYEFTGSTEITLVAELDVYEITYLTGANVTIDGDAAFNVQVGSAITSAQIPAYTFDEGYELDGYYVDDVKIENILEYVPTADTEIAIVAKKSVYTVTVVDALSAATVDKATYSVGDTITITPKDIDAVITKVSYKIGDAEAVALTLTDGKYTISGVTGDIEITVEAVAISFIAGGIEGYAVLAKNTQIVKIAANGANDKLVTIEGANVYYSERYDAYVAIVADSVKGTDLIGKLAIVDSETGTEAIAYDADVNCDNVVTAGDAALVSTMLHNPNNTVYSDLMRFKADFLDNGNYVTTTDCSAILYKSVGLNYPNNQQ